MTPQGQPFNLHAVGFLIVQDARGQLSPIESAGSYFGVDRLPLWIAPDPMIREALGEPLVDDPKLFDALTDYFNTIESHPTPFIPRCERAMSLLPSLGPAGVALELLFCELAFGSSDEERTTAYPRLAGERPNVSVTYGFDVAWPNCKHSAIRQPGVVPGNENWLNRLNNWGLLSEYEYAVELRETYLRVYPYPPFDIFLVHGVADGPNAGRDNVAPPLGDR